MMNHKIRIAVPTDEAFLWQMLYEAAHMRDSGEDLAFAQSNPDLARYVVNWGLPDDFGVIAEIDNKPIGAIWFRLFKSENRGYGYVDDETPELAAGILPAYTGKGVGSALMTHLLRYASDKYPAISLSVRADNQALRLYKRFGFEIVPDSQSTNRVEGISYSMVLNF